MYLALAVTNRGLATVVETGSAMTELATAVTDRQCHDRPGNCGGSQGVPRQSWQLWWQTGSAMTELATVMAHWHWCHDIAGNCGGRQAVMTVLATVVADWQCHDKAGNCSGRLAVP